MLDCAIQWIVFGEFEFETFEKLYSDGGERGCISFAKPEEPAEL